MRVVNVTCDSPRVQLAMMTELGANLDPTCLDLHICKEKPSDFVVKIVQFAEKVINVELKKDNWLQKYFFDMCNMKVCNNFVSLYGDIFKSMDNHSYELMKTIVTCYLSIRFKSHARLMNEKIKKKSLRSKLMKIILHNHQ